MTASSMPANTIVASSIWVAIKEEFPHDPKFPWSVAGAGVTLATNQNIDQLIEQGKASVLRLGNAI